MSESTGTVAMPNYAEVPPRRFLELTAAQNSTSRNVIADDVAIALAVGLSGLIAQFSFARVANIDRSADREGTRGKVESLAFADAKDYGQLFVVYPLMNKRENPNELVWSTPSKITSVPLKMQRGRREDRWKELGMST